MAATHASWTVGLSFVGLRLCHSLLLRTHSEEISAHSESSRPRNISGDIDGVQASIQPLLLASRQLSRQNTEDRANIDQVNRMTLPSNISIAMLMRMDNQAYH